MKNHLYAVAILLLLGGGLWWVLFSPQATPSPAGGTGGLVLMDFYADWCPPCRTMKPVVQQLAVELSGRVAVMEINVEKERAMAAQYNIRSIPTFVVTQDGVEIARQSGAMSKEALLALVGH